MRELIVIVGIPKAVRAFIENPLKKEPFRKDIELFLSSGLESCPRYTQPHIETICEETMIKINSYADPPEKLRFLYLPCPETEDDLLRSLFLAGDIHRVIFESSVQTVKSQDAPNIVTSISHLIHTGLDTPKFSKRSCQILPPNNFTVNGHECLFDKFMDCFICKSMDIAAVDTLLQHKTDRYGKKIYKDHRGCLYSPCKQNEQHGKVSDKINALHKLKGMYRFGWLFGSGFHHDVQHHTKQVLHDYQFQCSINGAIQCKPSTRYVNIYLNDFVRGNTT